MIRCAPINRDREPQTVQQAKDLETGCSGQLIRNLPDRTGSPPLPRPILQCLGEVRCFDVVCAGEIGDGAGEFEDAVVGAGGALQLLDGG